MENTDPSGARRTTWPAGSFASPYQTACQTPLGKLRSRCFVGDASHAAVAVGWLVQGVLHLGYHIGHLDGLGATDKAGLVVSLVLVPLLALVALCASMSERRP